MKCKWEEIKIKGNDEFHKKNYLGAIGLYTEAISKIIIKFSFGSASRCFI